MSDDEELFELCKQVYEKIGWKTGHSYYQSYIKQAELQARIDELKEIQSKKTREEGNEWDEFWGHCNQCQMVLESEDCECACDYLTEKRLATIEKELEEMK